MGELAAISKARSKNWQAAAWRLGRRNPEQWAATHRPPVASANPDATNNEFVLAYNLAEDTDEPSTKEP